MKYLVAVDGSDESRDALAYAMDLAEAMGASITVVHAVNPSAFEAPGGDPMAGAEDADRHLIVESVETAEQRGMEVLDEASAFASERGSDAETELLYGDPVGAITDYAESAGFDAVFVGHRGRSERTDLLVGSVAKEVIERTTIPVTVVR